MTENTQTIGTPLDVSLDIDKLLFGDNTQTETPTTADDILADLEEVPSEPALVEETPPVEPQTPEPQIIKVVDYSELIKDLVESNEWEDVDVTIGEETVGILELADVDKDTFLLLKEVKIYLDKKYKPDGYNVGWNVGKVGGQNVAHAHLHVLPRYKDEPLAGKGIRFMFKQ